MKVISFSLWGHDAKYCVGAIRNAQLAREIYPGWVTRFYVGKNHPEDIGIQLLQHGNGWEEVAMKKDVFNKFQSKDGLTEVIFLAQEGDWRGMFWRFEAATDAEVMISRDCDSRLSHREKAAVNEWLASDKTFHIMRDHPWHGSPMLGGMWGVKGPNQIVMDLMAQWPQEDRYQTDQDFLKTMIYPIASKDAMIHAQFCAIEPDAIPFPTNRQGLEFVGQVFDEKEQTVAEHQNMLMKALKMQGEPVRRENLPEFLQ